MIGLYVIISMSAGVVQNCIFNKVCKKELSTNKHIYKYNTYVYLMCILLFGAMVIKENISLFTIMMGIILGVTTALTNLYKMKSLANGPMHLTLLVTSSSMIIPAMSGIFFGEAFSIAKLCIVITLIGFIYLSLGSHGDNKINKKWIIYCLIAFITQGTIGVLQKIHQTSAHRGEINGFLFVSFICSLIYCITMLKHNNTERITISKKNIIMAIICGLCVYFNNYLNLMLSGILPTQIFFPLINGSAIVLSCILSVIMFKEHLTKRQFIGLCGGIASLIAICIVP